MLQKWNYEAVLSAVCLIWATATAAEITVGPYLLDATTESVVIMWHTDEPATGCVEFGRDSVREHTWRAVGKTFVHRVVLPGLRPDTRYHYRVRSAGATSPAYQFETAPKTPLPFTFAVYGDSRSFPDRHGAVIRAMRGSQPRFVIHTGDLVGSGTKPELWKPEFFDPAHDLMVRVPFFIAIGNHEDNADLFYQFFNRPKDRAWWSFNYGNCHFVILNSCRERSLDGPQVRWLRQDLAANKATWTFAAFHHPPVSSASHKSDVELLENWGPILAENGVDIVFNGHDHTYERSRPIRYDPTGQLVTYVVSGGGGAPTYSLDKRPWTVNAKSALHFCEIRVDGGRLEYTVFDDERRVIDSTVLTKEDGSRRIRFEPEETPMPVRELRDFAGADAILTRISNNRECRIARDKPIDLEKRWTVANTLAAPLGIRLTWKVPQGTAWEVFPTKGEIELQPGATREMSFHLRGRLDQREQPPVMILQARVRGEEFDRRTPLRFHVPKEK